jgi:hypothetical protein
MVKNKGRRLLQTLDKRICWREGIVFIVFRRNLPDPLFIGHPAFPRRRGAGKQQYRSRDADEDIHRPSFFHSTLLMIV